MKRLWSLFLGVSFVTCVAASEVSVNVTVEVKNIRNNQGNILVMAQIDDHSTPVYGWSKITGHTAQVVLKNVGTKECVISVFHDENGNWKLDTDERGIPIEGFARKIYKPDSHEPFQVKLYYFQNEAL